MKLDSTKTSTPTKVKQKGRIMLKISNDMVRHIAATTLRRILGDTIKMRDVVDAEIVALQHTVDDHNDTITCVEAALASRPKKNGKEEDDDADDADDDCDPEEENDTATTEIDKP